MQLDVIWGSYTTALLLYIAYRDYKEGYIEDWAILALLIPALISSIYSGDLKDSSYGLLAGFGCNCLFYLLFYLFYEAEVFGQGDVLLMAAIGAILGFKSFISYFLLQALGSGLLAFGYLLATRKKDAMLPLAPIYVFWLALYVATGKPDLVILLVQSS